MTPHATSLLFATAAPLTLAAITVAQDHEPMRLTQENRGNWVVIEDPVRGIEPYYATFDDPGVWAEGDRRSDGGSDGEAGQWTNISEDHIGGFIYSDMSSYGGLLRRSGSVLHAYFDVERTGMLRAFADFSGFFSEHVEESHAVLKLRRVEGDDLNLHVYNWGRYGDGGRDAAHFESLTELIYPGRYYFYAQVQTDVRGVEMQPNAGSMEIFTSLEIDRLPDCGEPAAGSCTESRGTPSCADAECCELVCAVDPFCCATMWDVLCVAATEEHCGPCIGDLNHDGTVDGADQGLLFAAWGPQSPTFVHPADLNADGIVDGKDFGLLMANWGGC